MQIVCARFILVVQLTIRSDTHRPTFFLRPRIESLHQFVLLTLSSVFLKEDWIEVKSPVMQGTLLLALLAAHLQVVVFSNDDVTVHFLDDRLLDC